MTMKKYLALFLSLVLLLIPLSSVAAFAEAPAEGYEQDGTSFTVYTPEGYNAVAAIIMGEEYETYKEATITLANALVFPNSEANFTPLGSKTKPFNGTIDGAGYTISGLKTATDTATTYRALVGYTGTGCTVRNLTITDSAFYGKEYVSAVIGAANSGNITVSNVRVRNTTITGNATGGNNTAGLCGRFVGDAGVTGGDATFENCTVDATISAFKNAAGICGGEASSKTLSVTIRNCVVAGDIETTVTSAKTGCAVGFFGWTNGVNLTIENSVCIANLKGAVKECSFVNNLLRASTITVTDTIGIGKAFGNFNKDNMTVAFTNCAVIDPSAVLGEEVALWDTTPASVPGTLTIDGEAQDFLTATLPMISFGELKTRVAKMYADIADPTFLANVNGMITRRLWNISGIALQGLQETAPAAGTLSIRFLGTIAASYTQFNALGFDIAYTDPSDTHFDAQEVAVKTVYTSILASEGGEMVAHNASDFDASYIFALTLEDVPAVGTCTFTVTPFVCSGETKLTGMTYEITYTNGAYVRSTPVVGRD